jgi:hypothetical protein
MEFPQLGAKLRFETLIGSLSLLLSAFFLNIGFPSADIVSRESLTPILQSLIGSRLSGGCCSICIIGVFSLAKY